MYILSLSLSSSASAGAAASDEGADIGAGSGRARPSRLEPKWLRIAVCEAWLTICSKTI